MGDNTSRQKAKSVTHVSGTKCHLSLRPLTEHATARGRAPFCAGVEQIGASLYRVASLLGGCDLALGHRRRHCFEHSVASHECMKQRPRDMQQDQREECESKIEMRAPEQRMQAVALRQDRRKMPP